MARPVQRKTQDQGLLTGITNIFDPLSTAVSETQESQKARSNSDEDEDSDQILTTEESAACDASIERAHEDEQVHIKDDDLSEFFDFSFSLLVCRSSRYSSLFLKLTLRRQELDQLYGRIRECWLRTLSGEMSMTLAAWLTNAAVEFIKHHCHDGRFSMCLGIYGSEDMITKAMEYSSDGHSSNKGASPDPELSPFSSLVGLVVPQSSIEDAIMNPTDYSSHTTEIFEAPEAIFKSRDDKAIMDLLIDSMKRLFFTKPSIQSDLIKDSSPYILHLSKCGASGSQGIPIHLAFGLYVMISSYKLLLPKASRENPRAKVLHLAQNAHKSVSRLLNSRRLRSKEAGSCPNCAQFNLEREARQFRDDLCKFLSEKRFDLYYQSPMVAGPQIYGIAAKATQIGVAICNQSQVLGVVVHL